MEVIYLFCYKCRLKKKENSLYRTDVRKDTTNLIASHSWWWQHITFYTDCFQRWCHEIFCFVFSLFFSTKTFVMEVIIIIIITTFLFLLLFLVTSTVTTNKHQKSHEMVLSCSLLWLDATSSGVFQNISSPGLGWGNSMLF